MSIEVTARHMHDAEGVQDYAKSKAERMCEDFDRIEHVHVVLDIEKHRNIAKVFLQARGHLRLEADETSDDMYKSIDEAFDKAEVQLRKVQDKVRDHKGVMRENERTKEAAS